MPFAYYERLTPRQKQIYRASDRIERVELAEPAALAPFVARLEASLATGRRRATEEAAQELLDALTAALDVPPLRVRVLERRPAWTTGELHGLYESRDGGPRRVTVWMRTARRVQIVRFRTFLRTLLHELCHHLDYERFRLADSFHTEGFYKRESSLVRQLCPAPAGRPGRAARADGPDGRG